MNGSTTGIIPTMEVGGNNGNNSWGGSMGEWIIGLVALGMLGNGGLFGGFGGGNGMYEFPWLLTGQQGINNNTNNGFDTLHLSNQIEGVRDGVNNLTTQICGSTADVIQAVNSGFAGAEISSNARQIANMQQGFNNTVSMLNGFNNIGSRLDDCCCENRLASCQTQNTIISEAASTRFADANNTRDIIDSNNKNSQAILDKLCQLELDNLKSQLEAKNDLIGQLRQENLYARGQASQVQQTADIRLSEEQQFESFYNRLKNCPVNAVAVYGNTPVFTCPNNNGCGCGYNTTSQFI